MTGDTPKLGSVKEELDRLRKVAENVYPQHPTVERSQTDAWSLDDYLAGIDALEQAIDAALGLPIGSMERLKTEKRARNVLANALYYRGRLDLKTGRLGVFRKKVGEKNVHWAPTELSRQADRLACEPLRHIYKETERLLDLSHQKETD